jgi:murein DD-endopeptidase MepM/ murein hydrolase activator NlpD/prophage tail gpP-like protein
MGSPILNPSKCRAVITTEWTTDRKYRRKVFSTVESYWIDSAFDNDSDQWTVQIGDPDSELMALMKRDAEVRVQLFGVGQNIEYLHSGFADEIFYTTTGGSWTISGRDMSSLAVDSIAPPQVYKHVRAANLIGSQARHIGMTGNINLKKTPVYKREYTDGSESYWEFWYRLLRKDQMWLWSGPDGSLNAGELNYSDAPTYFLGQPPAGASRSVARKYIPIIEGEFTKNVRGRVYEVWVQGHKGDEGFVGKAFDPMMRHWIKKPRKIVDDATAQNQKAAVRHAWEEIFESKVGELEFKITIADPMYFIRQNRIARLRIPGTIDKEFFVVGTRVQADEQGFVQEVRLREKQFAASRRVPEDPKLAYPPTREQTTGVGVNIQTGSKNWGDYFVKAAREFCGPWNFNLFLAVLLGICDQETGFTNERVLTGVYDHMEWFDFKAQRDYPDDPIVSHGLTYEQYKRAFENENPTRAVGPMQLYTLSYKHWADDWFKPNFHDQYKGGRWHPEFNIRAGARALAGKLAGLPPKDENIWQGVRAYNGSGAAADKYARQVKAKVLTNPGYLQQVQQAYQAAQQARGQSGTVSGATQVPVGSGPLGKGFPYQKNIIGYPYVGTHRDFGNWQSDNATDIRCKKGTPVYAVHDGTLGNYGVLPGSGTVIRNPTPSGQLAGNRVNIMGREQSSYYAHMMDLSAEIKNLGREGMRIRAGQLIGYSGVANGVAHLHFAVKNGSPFHYVPGGDPRHF